MTDVAPEPELRYDPYDYGIDANAHAVWRRLRDDAPLYRNDEYDFFALSRYDDVLAGLLDHDTYRSGHGTVLEMITEQEYPVPMMIMRDPPAHTRLRKLASRAFTPRAISGLEPRVRSLCAAFLDPFVGSGGFDYVDQFAALLPPTVILALLGFPEGLERELREEADATLHVDDPADGGGGLISAEGNLGAPLFALLDDLADDRRADPGDDLISALVTTELETDDGTTRPLNREELQAYVALIAGAGAETVARMLGWAIVLLAEHPRQQQALRDDHTLIPNAIEEILRYEAPSPVQARWVEHDVEWHGQTVPAGSKLLLLNGSADRDERHFDDADRFDVARRIDRHLAFGYGTHFCIGSALARLEGRIALEETLTRFGPWQVDPEGLEWVHTSTVRGYHRVPVVFD